MTRPSILALLLCLASTAVAQEPPWGQRMQVVAGSGACFAWIEVYNRAGHYNAAETLSTAEGDVTVYYTTVGSHAPGADDNAEVLELPDGVAAQPMFQDIVDGEIGLICLMKYQGG